jgi:hypothetical protein
MSAARRRTRRGVLSAVLSAIAGAIVVFFSSRSPGRAAPQPAAPAASASARATPTGTASATAPENAANSPASRVERGIGFASRQRLVEHYEKHGGEFPGLSMDAYLLAAQSLRDQSVSRDVLEARRKDGVITRFDRRDGSFLAVNRDRTIRTFFRPNDGESYFRRQAARAPGRGG